MRLVAGCSIRMLHQACVVASVHAFTFPTAQRRCHAARPLAHRRARLHLQHADPARRATLAVVRGEDPCRRRRAPCCTHMAGKPACRGRTAQEHRRIELQQVLRARRAEREQV